MYVENKTKNILNNDNDFISSNKATGPYYKNNTCRNKQYT